MIRRRYLALRTAMGLLTLLMATGCGEPTRLDECQDSDSALDCELCCEEAGLGELGVRFGSGGSCTCIDPAEEG